MTFTLPSAVPGMMVGIQRLTPDATYDVAIQAASGEARQHTATASLETLAAVAAALSRASNRLATEVAAWVKG
jgi:hypothetical protein